MAESGGSKEKVGLEEGGDVDDGLGCGREWGDVMMLRSGGLTRTAGGGKGKGLGSREATESLTRYCRGTAFKEWGDRDEAWLCLSPKRDH
jgi:hypothetical protein